MSASVNHLESRLFDGSELLEDIMPSAITLAMMLRHRKFASWLRTEFDGYQDRESAPPYRRQQPGHIVAKSPQYGWIPAPIEEEQKAQFGRLDLVEGTKELEQICLSCKKGSGHRVPLEADDLERLQKGLNLNADLAISVSRQTYSDLLRTVRAAICLWTRAVMAEGIEGEHNHYEKEERARVAHLDTPEVFWQQAMEQLEDLGMPDIKEVGFFGRVFGRAS